MATTTSSSRGVDVRLYGPDSLIDRLAEQNERADPMWLSHDLRWLGVLRDGLRQIPYCIEGEREGRVVGVLPLMYVKSLLFGRYLVGLPYLNSGGVQTDDEIVARALVDRAVQLADRLGVKSLELRHETALEHPSLTGTLTSKVHMRLGLPATSDELWTALDSKVRNQIRKGEKQKFEVEWGTHETVDAFYDVFSQNMRDLGTPVFGRKLFLSIVQYFPDAAEFCVVKLGGKPVAAALLTHGRGVTEVPSASSLRAYNSTNANMWMYWQLLQRAIEREQHMFDFGRSSHGSNTLRFKRQWGAEPHPAVWQYYVRRGSVGEMRPDNPKMKRAIALWQRLPVPVTRLLGPPIVRGIP